MGWFISAGGLPGLIVLVFGLVLIGYAVGFAIKPREGRVRAVVALGIGVVMAGLGGLAANLVAVGRFIGSDEGAKLEVGRVLVVGVTEAMTPLISAFTLVAVAAILTALGLRRQVSNI